MIATEFYQDLYHYRATCPDDDHLFPRRVRIYDGDTIRLDVDLGLFTWKHRVAFRLWGINAPEMNKPETKDNAIIVRDYLKSLILGRNDIGLETIKDTTDSLGSRYLAKIYLPQENGEMLFVNDHLIEKFPEFVIPYMRD